jgi:hypothetical protein
LIWLWIVLKLSMRRIFRRLRDERSIYRLPLRGLLAADHLFMDGTAFLP